MNFLHLDFDLRTGWRRNFDANGFSAAFDAQNSWAELLALAESEQRGLECFGLLKANSSFTIGTNRFKDVGVRYKSNGTFMSSRGTLKRSLKIDLNQFVKVQKLGGMSQFNLQNKGI